jgi:hypothetical protein
MVRLAKGLRFAALLAAIAGIVLAFVAVAVSESPDAAGALEISIEDESALDLPLPLRLIVTVTPALTFAYAMWQLAKLLKLAAAGEVFSAPAGTYLRRFGVWLLVTTVLQVALSFVVKGLYYWLTGAEHGELNFVLHSSNLWNLFISLLFMLVARVLADAYAIAEENKQIV